MKNLRDNSNWFQVLKKFCFKITSGFLHYVETSSVSKSIFLQTIFYLRNNEKYYNNTYSVLMWYFTVQNTRLFICNFTLFFLLFTVSY